MMDVTIAPAAGARIVPFAPAFALSAVQRFLELYPEWGDSLRLPSGFNRSAPAVDSRGWISSGHYGLDQGIIVLMIENYRTGLIWKLMRNSGPIRTGLKRAGFTEAGYDPLPAADCRCGPAGLSGGASRCWLRRKSRTHRTSSAGGNCLHTGCIPSKTIIRTSRLYGEMRDAERFGGLVPSGIAVDFRASHGARATVCARTWAVRLCRETGRHGHRRVLRQARFASRDSVTVADKGACASRTRSSRQGHVP